MVSAAYRFLNPRFYFAPEDRKDLFGLANGPKAKYRVQGFSLYKDGVFIVLKESEIFIGNHIPDLRELRNGEFLEEFLLRRRGLVLIKVLFVLLVNFVLKADDSFLTLQNLVKFVDLVLVQVVSCNDLDFLLPLTDFQDLFAFEFLHKFHFDLSIFESDIELAIGRL